MSDVSTTGSPESNKTTTRSTSSLRSTLFESELSELDQVEFKPTSSTSSSRSKQQHSSPLRCRLYAVRLSRLVSSSSPSLSPLKSRVRQLFSLKRSRDLVHTVCALYDTCLPDIGAQTVYDCVTALKSYTILVVRDEFVAIGGVDESARTTYVASEYEDDDCLSSVIGEDDEEDDDDDKNDENDKNHPFKNVFSDLSDSDNDEEEEESDEEDENDNTTGVKSYLQENGKAKKRKTKEKDNNDDDSKLSIIRGLVACATLQRVCTQQLPGHDEWVIDLELLSVRRKYRSHGIGKYLVASLVQDHRLVGHFDAVVTSSDSEAVSFYEKYSFSVDPILNSRYASIGDIWTNTTKMCYIPPYMNETTSSSSSTTAISFIDELTHMERDYTRWQKQMFGAYQSQAKLFLKLKQEVFALKASVCAKDGIIDDLRQRNEILERQNRLLKMRLRDREKGGGGGDDDDDDELKDLISDLENIQS